MRRLAQPMLLGAALLTLLLASRQDWVTVGGASGATGVAFYTRVVPGLQLQRLLMWTLRPPQWLLGAALVSVLLLVALSAVRRRGAAVLTAGMVALLGALLALGSPLALPWDHPAGPHLVPALGCWLAATSAVLALASAVPALVPRRTARNSAGSGSS